MPIYNQLDEFTNHLMTNSHLTNGVVMGIDPGTKRIGVAFSDRAQSMAFSTLIADNLEMILPEFKSRDAVAAVVGLPRNTDGGLGPSAKRAEKQAEQLEELLSCPILLWEEWYSTVAMEKMLIKDVDMSRAKRKKNLDKLAAAFILQGALDAIRNHSQVIKQ